MNRQDILGVVRGPVCAIAVGVTLALLVGEWLGRMLQYLPTRPSPAHVALTRRVGPLPSPRSSVLSESAGEYRQSILFNDLGFRSPTSQFETDGDRRPRILVLGDSYTAAWQVPLEQRFTEQLERLEPRWSLLNLGMPNWGTDQEYLLLLSYPLALSPDVVLLVMTPLNDVEDNGRAVLRGAPRVPHFIPVDSRSGGTSALREVSWRYKNPFEETDEERLPLRVRRWLRLHSVWYQAARGVWKTLEAGLWDARGSSGEGADDTANRPGESGVFAAVGADPRWEVAWLITDSLLGLAKAAAQARGAELRIVLVPHYALVHPAFRVAWADPGRFDPASVHDRLSAMARAHDIPVLDITSPFVEYHRSDRARRLLFFARDKHFTALGHCLTAVLIARWLDPATLASVAACDP